MWSKHDHNVAVSGAVSAECSPACLASERESCKASKREYFAPSMSEQRGDIFFRVVMVHLVRAGAVSEERVLSIEPKGLQLLKDSFLN